MTATVISVPDCTGLTMTLEVPSCVLAQRARCAGRVRAVIYQFASTRGLSRVSGLTRTNLDMFLRCTNRIHAARIVSETGDSTSVQIADLPLGTVLVDFALDRLTADLIVFRVSEETVLTCTRCDVIVSLTLGVTAAEYQIASCTALGLSDIVFNALFVISTVTVRRAT